MVSLRRWFTLHVLCLWASGSVIRTAIQIYQMYNKHKEINYSRGSSVALVALRGAANRRDVTSSQFRRGKRRTRNRQNRGVSERKPPFFVWQNNSLLSLRSREGMIVRTPVGCSVVLQDFNSWPQTTWFLDQKKSLSWRSLWTDL